MKYSKEKKEVCIFWKQGKCLKGSKCKWIHCVEEDSESSWIDDKQRYVEKRPVIIKGNWADVEDTDDFFT